MQISKKIALVSAAMVIVTFVAWGHFLQLAWADDMDSSSYGQGGWSISGGSEFYGLAHPLFSQVICFFVVVVCTHWFESRLIMALVCLMSVTAAAISCVMIYPKLVLVSPENGYRQDFILATKWSVALDVLIVIVAFAFVGLAVRGYMSQKRATSSSV